MNPSATGIRATGNQRRSNTHSRPITNIVIIAAATTITSVRRRARVRQPGSIPAVFCSRSCQRRTRYSW
ncbi:hypothetical protein AWN90_14580 [Nocardia terpenica]|uniref:Uncharacterized protein n=1 Tax=Nocardia terpenica TaxID=455432 RepID=A0A164I011_9NOCA|nr:hypothetical protein AWN90_14580 [Nocardia terpenica]